MITGMDLIEWQLSVSRARPLVKLKAHLKDRSRPVILFHTPRTRSPASVMRLKRESTLKSPNSEDTWQLLMKKEDLTMDGSNFLPDTGKLFHVRSPINTPHRLETGFQEGDEISSHYDPMASAVISGETFL